MVYFLDFQNVCYYLLRALIKFDLIEEKLIKIVKKYVLEFGIVDSLDGNIFHITTIATLADFGIGRTH